MQILGKGYENDHHYFHVITDKNHLIKVRVPDDMDDHDLRHLLEAVCNDYDEANS
ncbi:hypothetical protein MXE81_06375 [Mammaliicoccus sciuri]|jgi:hypothetical protein|uniref:Uncharacterized protein n=1 Tax=Mammaliicoccus sciuri TaxID=1296 RepID=A0A6M2AJC4_MAMSC|nr:MULTISPECIES: hypothetical protein [Mammaliicoccus]EZX23773.1 hypothetical protein V070_00850 [Staphylococcus aureus C0673]MBF9299258.1 hypothetical protein [Staphylococcus schleiferi]MBN4911087.1 hypothetical protein [Staphylococcus sp. EG-SA-13]MBF0719249.1 hypothetical protein [Mammaliicoccus sciuri]MBF0774191.1 hypothetical protein [Mammaliicoccus sciuri]